MTAVLLAAALAAQQPDLRDAECGQPPARLAADRAIRRCARWPGARSRTEWGWGGDLADEPMPAPMPTPMPVPMPMPFAGGGPGIAGPERQRHRAGTTLDAKVLAVFRTALRDQSRCVRRIAARMVAREKPTWAASEFGALAKDADAGLREIGLLGLGELEDPRTIGTMTDRPWRSGRRTSAPWPRGRSASSRTRRRFAPLGKALGDESPLVRRRAAWALGEIEDEAALAPLERALRDRDATRAAHGGVGDGRDRERQGGADAADGARGQRPGRPPHRDLGRGRDRRRLRRGRPGAARQGRRRARPPHGGLGPRRDRKRPRGLRSSPRRCATAIAT